MKCIEAQRLVKAYIEGQLSDRQLEQFLEHVEHCPECYEELEIYFSIYETLGGSEDKEEAYDFEEKLKQDMKNSKRYLCLRKAYRFFRFAVVLLAELLLVCTIVTGIELKQDSGREGTTIYRVIYGKNGAAERKEHETETDSQGLSGKETDRTGTKKETAWKIEKLPQIESTESEEASAREEQAEETQKIKPKTGAEKDE